MAIIRRLLDVLLEATLHERNNSWSSADDDTAEQKRILDLTSSLQLHLCRN